MRFRYHRCRFTSVKIFAFILASIFVFQASTPALCMTNCILEPVETSTCCVVEQKSCCASMEASTCSVKEDEGVNEAQEKGIPCSDCCVPCCTAPLCCFFFQEVADFELNVGPLQLSAQLPSSNGTPNQGFRADCFQPPEII